MIEKPLMSGAFVHAYCTDASNFANRFATLLCGFVRQSKVAAAKPRYRPTVEQLYRDWSIDKPTNQIFVESGTDFPACHVLPIFSAFIKWLSSYVDRAAGDLRHAQLDGVPHVKASIS